MLSLLAFALGYGLIFHALGINWVKCWGFKNRLLVTIFSQVFGFVVALWMSSIVARLSLPTAVLWGSLFLFPLIGFLYRRIFNGKKGLVSSLDNLGLSARNQNGGFIATRRLLMGLTLLPSVAYAFLTTSSLFSTQLSFRIGPDVFGWARSVRAFCSRDSISQLADRVSSSLNGTELLRAFRRTPEMGETSIQQIPSFSDQMAAEFLIGADRSGVPMLAGGLCDLVGGEELTFSALGGLVSWAFFLLSLIGLFTMTQGVKRLGVFGVLGGAVVAVVAPLSFAILSVTLEGGFGQIITMPLFALAASLLFSETYRVKAFSVSVLLLLVGASTSYIDLVFIAGPFFLFGLILNRRLFGTLKYMFSHLRIAAVASLVAILPATYSMFRIGSAVIETGGAGGWHQGRVILPPNVFGLISSLPSGGVNSSPRPPAIWIVEIVVSMAIVCCLFIIGRRRSDAIVIALSGWLVLTLFLYSGGTTNNYIVWKYSAYASAVLPILFSGLSRAAGRQLRGGRVRSKLLPLTVATVLLFSAVSTSISWVIDWERTKLNSLPKEAIVELNSITPAYDIIVLPGSLEAAHLGTLTEDLRFGGPSRSAFEIQRSLPVRPLILIRVLGGPCEISCMRQALSDARSKNYLGSVRIQGLKYFEAFELIEERP